MPRALVESEPKSNPYITKGINRSLLTPCRRVGLSRKRKTLSTSSDNDNKSFTDCKSSSSLETTPVNTTLLSTNTESENKESSSKNKSAEVSKSRKKNKVSKHLIIDEEDETKLSNNIEKFNSEIVEVRKSPSEEDSNDEIPVIRKKPKLIRLNSDSDSCSNKSFMDSDALDFKPELNLKKGPKSKPKNDSPKNSKKIEPMVLIKVTNSKVEEKELPVLKKTKKIKRSLSMKKSSEEEIVKTSVLLKKCSVDLGPIRMEENSDSSSSHSEITQKDLEKLEKTVQEKRTLLDELKRAEIYQTKHNIEDLEKLTSQWKSGCISALNDLCPHLQDHAYIDMETLLKNLRVPNHLISLQNGELV